MEVNQDTPPNDSSDLFSEKQSQEADKVSGLA